MNKKGFTLIELIVTIAILALVTTVVITLASSISDSINKKQRENLISEIETTASKYAFDTGKTLIFVDELVNEGYYQVSDDSGKILDPNNEKLNCYVVKMTKKGTYYTAKFLTDSKYELANGSCDSSKLNTEDNTKINIVVYNNGTVVSNTNNWIKGTNISLTANSSSLTIDCTSNECSWTSNSGLSRNGNKTISVGNQKLLKAKYTFQYSVYNGTKINRYTKSVDLKIDNEAPIIYENETIVYDRNIPSASKRVELSASDGNGSGISGYYIGKYTGQSCSGITFRTSKEFTLTSSGNYLICVKDSTGNIASKTVNLQMTFNT